MTFESNYKFLQDFSKMFRLDDNAKTSHNKQKTTSIANNSNHEQKRDQLCANMISQVVKVATDRVKSNNQQRTASVVSLTNKIDEVGQLQTLLARYHY